MSCVEKRGGEYVLCRVANLSWEAKAALAALVAVGVIRMAHDAQWEREKASEHAGWTPPSGPAYADRPRPIELDDFLGVYRGSAARGLSAPHRDMCIQALELELYKRTFLSVEGGSEQDQVEHSLWHRVPVYFGQPRLDMYDEQRFSELHGLTTERVQDTAHRHANARYIICGPVATPHPGKWWVAHAWGPNLESGLTADAKIFHNFSRPGQAREWYAERIRKLYLNIFRTGREVLKRAKVGRVLVRLPAIGQGAFLTAIAPSERGALRALHQEAIGWAAAQQVDSRVKVSLAYYGYPDPITVAETDRVTAKHSANLFEVDEFGALGDTAIVLVNAWDNQSFIGNGLLGDPTIDGMMVAGYGPGRAFPNSSYTHNPFLSTHLFNPTTWVLPPRRR